MNRITSSTIEYKITLGDHSNMEEFINQWSKVYKYSLEEKYDNNISTGLESEIKLLELFLWKNGTGDNVSSNKMKTINGFILQMNILRELQQSFNWNTFEREFEPQKNSSIWKIFLLHIIDPQVFPIFDQHVFRAFTFITEGTITELPQNKGGIKHKEVYAIYKETYLPWFSQIRDNQNIKPKRIDEALFSFGRVLKSLRNVPAKISKAAIIASI
ncbi:hypothetical protein BH09BAC1_BH09BAC1_00440 [soil metagenome]